MFCPLSIECGNAAQWVSGIAAALVFGIALHRDYIRQLFQKPNLKFLNVIKNRQDKIWIYRLVIKNDSRYIAKNVEFDIEEVIDNGQKRNNFLPAPHSWTHHNLPLRDIFPRQTAYLDIVKIDNQPDIPPIIYAHYISGIHDMVFIKKGTTILKLKYYTENGQTGNIHLKVTWNGNPTILPSNLPRIEITD